jgi:hypothetical protein
MPRYDTITNNPETLAGLQAKDIDVWVWCPECYREVSLPVEDLMSHLPASFPIPRVGEVLKCSQCGRKGPAVRPDWKTW